MIQFRWAAARRNPSKLALMLGLALLGGVVTLAAVVPAVAQAADEEEGIFVTLRVTDPEGNPVKTASVRNTQEQERHRVNADTGEFPINVFYLPDGSEVLVTKGATLTFEMSAPGFQNVKFSYIVRKHKNLVPVVLTPMTIELETEENTDDVPIQFGRDKPIE